MKYPVITPIRFLTLTLCVLLAVSLVGCADDAAPAETPSPRSAPLQSAPTPTSIPARAVPTSPSEPQAGVEPEPAPTATAAPRAPTAIPTRALTATSVPTPTQPTATPAGEDDERRGGTLNLLSRQVVQRQDVHKDVSAALAAWGPGIAYSRLMRFRSGADVDLPSRAVECEVCSEWAMVDGATFEFRLREDVRWQDAQPLDGRRLLAGDIAFSYERQRSEGMPNGALLHIVDAIEAPSDDLLRITLHAPDADFLGALADGHSKIVAEEAVELSGDLLEGPTIGSGAWLLEDVQTDMTFIFGRNDDYFVENAPLLDRLRVHTIPDGNTAYAAFRVNNVDVHRLRPAEWEEFRQQKPDASMLEFKETGTGLEVAFKTTEPPFDDIRVRRAAMLAMRPNSAIHEIWRGAAYLTQGAPLGRADWQLSAEELDKHFDDRQSATALLAEAVGALPVPVVIKVGDFDDDYRTHAERIAGEMRAAGFDPELEVVDRRRFGERVWFGGEYRMFVGPIAPVASPNAYLLTVLSSDGAWNTTGHKDEALDALILAQAGEYDIAERRRLVVEAQKLALEKAYRFMPAAAVSLWAWWPKVRGLEPNFVASEYSHWERVWLDE